MVDLDHLECCVCDTPPIPRGELHARGWQFAANRPHRYVCGPGCAQVLKAIDDEKEAERKRRKKEKRK